MQYVCYFLCRAGVVHGTTAYCADNEPALVGAWLARMKLAGFHFDLVKRCGLRHTHDIKKVKDEDLVVRDCACG